MEKFSEVHDFHDVFCNYQNVLEYFNEFYDFLENSKCELEFIDTSKFSKCLQYLNHTNFFEIRSANAKVNECGGILFKIFDTLCLKYFRSGLIFNKKVEKISEIRFFFDSVSILIKVLLTKFKKNVSLKYLLLFISNYFQKYSPNPDNFSDAGESDEEQLQHILKLFVNILQSLDGISFSNYISSEFLIQVLNSFPFSNKNAVNVFINYIVPCLFTLTDYSHKKIVLEIIWKKIVMYYEANSNMLKESYHYSLLCHFTDLIFKEHFELENFSIYDDIVWKIIQNGLMSDNSYNRKQVIYVFKIILLLLKTKNDTIRKTFMKFSLFSMCTIKDLVIWNDLVVLFEVLEEKQIHVIKPVLPKFSRILQHASNSNSNSSNSFILHPSWITCFIRRMISHESKFIAKQGLSIAMNINFKECQIHELHSEEFIQVLIKGFNDQIMYSRMSENDNLSLFLSSKKIFDFLTEYIATFESNLQKVQFLKYLLKYVASESWCGVALLHLTFALTNLNNLPSWSGEDIIYLRKIIQGLKSHESIIRRAVEYWLIKSCILFIDWNTLSFEDIAELLFIFKSLERHTEIWNVFASKLKEVFLADCSNNLSIHKAQEFSFNCINKILSAYSSDQSLNETELHKMARLLIFLDDSFQEKGLNWSHLLQPLTSVLIDAPKRPYMSQDKFFGALQFYTLLLGTSQCSIKNTSGTQCSAIVNCLNNSMEFLEFIFQKSFMDIKGSDDIIHFQSLYNALLVLSSKEDFYELFLKLLPGFVVNYNSLPQHFLSKKIIILLFYSISSRQFDETKSNTFQSDLLKEFNYSLLLIIIDDHVIEDLSKSVFVNEAEKEVWQKLAAKSICKFWDVTSRQHIDQKNLVTALINQAQSMFDGGSKSTYAFTINCIQTLIPKLGLESMHVIDALFNSAWKACLELHGSEAYRPAITSFIDAVFQPYMLNKKCFDILYKYLGCFQTLSENTIGIFYLVIKPFCNAFPLKSLRKENFIYIPVLIHSLTYGPIHHKSQRTLEDTVTYICEHDDYFSNEFRNYNKPSIFVRVTVITYLLKSLYKHDSENEDKELVSSELINSLLDLDETTRSSKSSKFANSSSHRIRNRIWQIILLLQHNLVTKEVNEKILKTTLGLLEFENQQPSIRYLQEWVILKILNDKSFFIEDFLSEFENSLEKRPTFLVSLLSILTHLIIHDIHIENHIYKCFPILINYCMAQNFAVRLHSRFAITKLYSFCEKKKFTTITQKYDFLHGILLSQQSENILLEKGNIYKNLLKLQEDFYFAVFNPIKHFTLETIFYELPRLSNVASEEWIKPEYFKYQLDSKSEFVIPCFNTGNDLKNSVLKSWTDKIVEEPIVNENESFDYNFQKKICPSKCMIGFYDNDLYTETPPKKTRLIVIASLIDKIPNLGGLCRTCEVFGVEQFVIGSLKYTEDKEFQNLAVSADRWVSIKEVKPYHLKEYLCSLKEEGYTLVGAEQTDDSHKLSDFDFPKKSALLLGHEKEGIAVDLIQLLDACVEIPQQGIIRSLNVHVSGAIFIWEYARQQIAKPT